MSRLWCYNLHYFDYLQSPDLSTAIKIQLIKDWIENNPIGSPTAWEPYTASLRIVNWVKFLERARHLEGISEVIIKSLGLQTHWLYNHLELHILANHLFKNIKALIFSGHFLEGKVTKKWLSIGEKLLLREIKEQVLSDGGHFERSPMYHNIFLEDLLDLINIGSNSGAHCAYKELLEATALKAALFTRDIRLTDDEIPLFNDSALSIAANSDQLLQYAENILQTNLFDYQSYPQVLEFSHSGFYVLGDHSMKLIIDCGETGPRYQPGHTHCDTLSYELSVGKQRFIVDTGTFDYEPGIRRKYDRSTAAHNTVMIEQEEQSELWGLFRVARRASPFAVSYQKDPGGKTIFNGKHDGYSRLKGNIIHSREVIFYPDVGWSIKDLLEGKEENRVENFIHIHPDLSTRVIGDGVDLLDKNAQCVATIKLKTNCLYDISKSVYHPEFGLELENEVIRMHIKEKLPVTLEYDIIVHDPVVQ